MKFLFRWAFRLVLLLLVLAVSLVLLKDVLLKELFLNRFRAATGLEVRLDRLEIGLLSPTVSLAGLRIYNPAEFGGLPLLVVSEVYLDYDRALLSERKLKLRLLRVNVSEMDFVQNATGQNNLTAIFAALKQRIPPGSKPPLAFGGIDTLNLSVGMLKRVRLGPTNEVQTIRLGIQNEVLTALRTEADVYLAMARLAVRAGIQAVLPEQEPGLRPLPGPPVVPGPARSPAPRPHP